MAGCYVQQKLQTIINISKPHCILYLCHRNILYCKKFYSQFNAWHANLTQAWIEPREVLEHKPCKGAIDPSQQTSNSNETALKVTVKVKYVYFYSTHSTMSDALPHKIASTMCEW